MKVQIQILVSSRGRVVHQNYRRNFDDQVSSAIAAISVTVFRLVLQRSRGDLGLGYDFCVLFIYQ